MKRHVPVVVGAMCLAATGWAASVPAQERDADAPATSEVCPVGLRGLSVEPMTIAAGGALQLTVAPDQVSELRARLQRFARMHQQRMQRDDDAPMRRVGERAFAHPDAMIHHATGLRVIDIPNGARLEARTAPEHLEALRHEIHETAQQLATGRCPLALSIDEGAE
ncbi:MAG: hypothetical protein M3Y87_03180 [Myxococcota bacterium]|nr:hypothetical protein [Myxococcota bacterium]